MKLIVLHGPPASGKLTLANRLKEELGFNVLHNHLTVDIALEIYPEFGHGDFFEFVDNLRALTIEKACQNEVKGLIVTFCYDSLSDTHVIEQWQSIVEKYGGELIPIYLNVAAEVLAQRVIASSRAGTKKIQCPEELNSVNAKYEFGAIAHVNTVTVDTSRLCIQGSVEQILGELG